MSSSLEATPPPKCRLAIIGEWVERRRMRVVLVPSPFEKFAVAEYLDSFVPIFCSSGDAGVKFL